MQIHKQRNYFNLQQERRSLIFKRHTCMSMNSLTFIELKFAADVR